MVSAYQKLRHKHKTLKRTIENSLAMNPSATQNAPSSVISQNMHVKYIVVSHHPKNHKISVCSSIYHAFFSPKAQLIQADYLNPEWSQQDLLNSLRRCLKYDTLIVFNGMGSLLCKNSRCILNYALKHKATVGIYWHETCWMINYLASKNLGEWTRIKKYLINNKVKHLVVSGQSKQLVMYMFQKPHEDVVIVGEVIDLDDYMLSEKRESNQSSNKKTKILGSGLIESGNYFYRKGLDYFGHISHELHASKENHAYQFDWYGTDQIVLSEIGENSKLFDKVCFKGKVNSLSAYFRYYDIFLLSSRDDPFPIVALEALASGLPVFCFDSTGISEIVPQEFVASNYYEMIDNIKRYCEVQDSREAIYTPVFFRNIAQSYTRDFFLKKLETGCQGFSQEIPVYKNYFSRKNFAEYFLIRATDKIKYELDQIKSSWFSKSDKS